MRNDFEIELYGGSHERVVGVKIYGVPAGTAIDREGIAEMLKRRGAVNSPWSTPRKEADEVTFLSGVENDVANGQTIVAEVQNTNVKSSDYNGFSVTPRPSHADYVSVKKYGSAFPGGGPFSGRNTVGLCIAGAIAKDILLSRGIRVKAYVAEIGGVKGTSYKNTEANKIINAEYTDIYSLSACAEMTARVIDAKEAGDSVGGIIECMVDGVPVGIGGAFTAGVESKISYWLYGVPGVKGVEFGLGFGFANVNGSIANDGFSVSENDEIVTLTNNSGGINGGITNGMPITVSVALRPTPSISVPQKTVNLNTLEPAEISVKGRHDACILPRAVAGVESAVACALLSLIFEEA